MGSWRVSVGGGEGRVSGREGVGGGAMGWGGAESEPVAFSIWATQTDDGPLLQALAATPTEGAWRRTDCIHSCTKLVESVRACLREWGWRVALGFLALEEKRERRSIDRSDEWAAAVARSPGARYCVRPKLHTQSVGGSATRSLVAWRTAQGRGGGRGATGGRAFSPPKGHCTNSFHSQFTSPPLLLPFTHPPTITHSHIA